MFPKISYLQRGSNPHDRMVIGFSYHTCFYTSKLTYVLLITFNASMKLQYLTHLVMIIVKYLSCKFLWSGLFYYHIKVIHICILKLRHLLYSLYTFMNYKTLYLNLLIFLDRSREILIILYYFNLARHHQSLCHHKRGFCRS